MTTGAYDQVQREVASGREVEARALTRCALMLNDALTTKDNDITYEAVRLNYRLWLLFYSDIEAKRVQLPIEVERNVLALAAYVVKTAPRAFAGEEKVLEALININRNIAAGLLGGEVEAAPAMATAETAAAISTHA